MRQRAATTFTAPASAMLIWKMSAPVRPSTSTEYVFNANAMGTATKVTGAVVIQIIASESEKSLSPTTSESSGPSAEKNIPLKMPWICYISMA